MKLIYHCNLDITPPKMFYYLGNIWDIRTLNKNHGRIKNICILGKEMETGPICACMRT